MAADLPSTVTRISVRFAFGSKSKPNDELSTTVMPDAPPAPKPAPPSALRSLAYSSSPSPSPWAAPALTGTDTANASAATKNASTRYCPTMRPRGTPRLSSTPLSCMRSRTRAVSTSASTAAPHTSTPATSHKTSRSMFSSGAVTLSTSPLSELTVKSSDPL